MAITAVVLSIDAVVGEKGLLALMRAREEYAAARALAAIRSRSENQRLREQARRYREDPAAIEELARKDLGLIKPGEKLFIIRDRRPPRADRSPPGTVCYATRSVAHDGVSPCTSAT